MKCRLRPCRRATTEMLYYLVYHVPARAAHVLNVLRYITVRTALASISSLFLGLILGPWMIRRLRSLQIGQFIREEGPRSHQTKAGTPTMGGLLIVTVTLVPVLFWADLSNTYVLLSIFAMLAFGAIGLADDYSKVVRHRHLGLTGRSKFAFQLLVSVGAALSLLLMTTNRVYSTQLIVPFFKNFSPDLVVHSLLRSRYFWPAAFLPFLAFVVLVMVGSSNAVNLTDGLDGLAIGCVVVAAGALTILTYVTSHAGFSAYLDIQHVPQLGELTIFCGALVGAALAFLWYNAHPAEIFMGEVGSLAIGGSIGVVAVGVKQEYLQMLVEGIFVLEVISELLP